VIFCTSFSENKPTFLTIFNSDLFPKPKLLISTLRTQVWTCDAKFSIHCSPSRDHHCIFFRILVFSISSSIVIILWHQVFCSLQSLLLPLLTLDSTVFNIIAPLMCAWVYSMSTEWKKCKNIGNFGILIRLCG